MALRVNIREKRQQLGLNMKEAAQLTGIARSMWEKVERGERTPSMRVAERIAVVLDSTLDELFL